jgi:hypothetical protein
MSKGKLTIYLPEGDPVYAPVIAHVNAVVTDRQAMLRKWILLGYREAERSAGESPPTAAPPVMLAQPDGSPPEVRREEAPSAAPDLNRPGVASVKRLQVGSLERVGQPLDSGVSPGPGAGEGASPVTDDDRERSTSSRTGGSAKAPSVQGLL